MKVDVRRGAAHSRIADQTEWEAKWETEHAKRWVKRGVKYYPVTSPPPVPHPKT